MKDLDFDALLLAAKPDSSLSDSNFTDTVMQKVNNSEILSPAVRNMDVNKKETFIMKLKHLPKFAIVVIALAALVIASTGAYAAYKALWEKPTVKVTDSLVTNNGRSQVGLSYDKCNGKDVVTRYEVKKGATITAQEVPQVVQAHCELDAINAWGETLSSSDDTPIDSPIQGTDRSQLITSKATHIKSIDSTSATFVGLTKYNETDASYKIGSNVKFAANGVEVKQDQIKAGDAVVYVTINTIRETPKNGGMAGQTVRSELVGVVKLDLPFQYYDQLAWQSLAEVNSCFGNPNDKCLSGYIGAVDLYNGNAWLSEKGMEAKEIQGVINKIESGSVTLKSSSGTLFTINTSQDIVSAYNTNKADQYYNGVKTEIGSTLLVSYVEMSDAHNKTISQDELCYVYLQIEKIGKSDPVKAY